MASQDFLTAMDADFNRINHELQAHLKTHVDFISEVGEHILLSGGKRIRPILFVLCARLAGYRGDSEHHFSTLFEYLHAATLLHDDVIDNAEMRRGIQTANLVWGNAAAVLVGDFLYSKSFNVAVEMGDLRILEVLSRTTNRMAEGMVLELIHSHDFNLSLNDYMEVVCSKTAVLMSAACRIGGMMGSLTEDEVDRLGEYGLELGIAFQIVDDALDYSLTEQEFGKPVGKDVEEGKITLPLLHTLNSCTPAEHEHLVSLCDRDTYTREHLSEIISVVNRYGGVDYSMNTARGHVERALSHLEGFPESSGRRRLLELAEFVLERRF